VNAKLDFLINILKTSNTTHPYQLLDNLISDNENDSKLNNFIINELRLFKEKKLNSEHEINNLVSEYRLDSILSSYKDKKYIKKIVNSAYTLYEYGNKFEIYFKTPNLDIIKQIKEEYNLENIFYVIANKKTTRLTLEDKEKFLSKTNNTSKIKIMFIKK
jgi:hypothetical protein